jgi:aryl-alcohol dehydrogenase-like predicted oxidoreductase
LFLEQLDKVDKIKKDSKIDNQELISMALGFPLNHSAVSTVIAGMKTKEQVLQNLKAYGMLNL